MPQLIIIGANGELGSATAKYFLQKGYKVSGLIRNKSKAGALEKTGAEIIIGDLTNPASLKNIFNHTDIVLTAAHGLLGRGKNKSQNVDEIGHKILIEEAKKAGVKQFIYTSVNNPSPDHAIDFFKSKYSIEQYLINSGLNYTILRLPAFMEWHAYNLLGKNIVEKGKTTILGSGENPINFIAIKDIVAALDKIVLNENFYKKIIPMAGPEDFSQNEVAELFGKALGIKPKVGHVPIGALKILSTIMQPFHPGIARVMKFTIASQHTDETIDKKYTIEQFGLRPTTMKEFIESKIQKK